MGERCRRLSIPERQRSFMEEVERCWPTLRAASWSTEEVDALKRVWQDGDRFTDIGISSVQLSDRTVLRSEVRKLLTVSGRDDSARREREALQLEAENQERVARGGGSVAIANGERAAW
jgi:hypothetical protein